MEYYGPELPAAMISVFLSHSSKDKPFVRELAGFLRRDEAIRVWLDETRMEPGDNVVDEIEAGLDADVVLLILSPDSVNSRWVGKEWTAAFWQQANTGKPKVVSVLYRECRIPRLLANGLRFDLRTNQPEGFRAIRSWLLGEQPVRLRPNHAPPRPPLFIGREDQLRNLRERLALPGTLVHVLGMPERGKTLLALEFAHRFQQDFEAVYWLSCQIGNLAALAGELSRQLGLKLEGDLDQVASELRDFCAGRRCLVVLDGVEDESPAPLIPGGSASVLITTRRDNLPFLRDLQPEPLPLFTEAQCFELFQKVIGETEVERHRDVCRELFRRLGYLPGGVARAASLVRYDQQYAISSLAADLPKEVTQRTSEAIAALDPEARTLLAAMAACAPDGFRLSLAASVAGMQDTSLPPLNALVRRSLVEVVDRTDGRYRLHALVRESADGAAFGERHAHAVRERYRSWETNWRECEEDLPEFQVALDWALRHTPGLESGGLAGDLAYFGFSLTRRLGRLTDALGICKRMNRAAGERDDLAHLQAWFGNEALILKAWGRLKEAMTLFKLQEKFSLELMGPAHVQTSLGNLASTLEDLRRLRETMDFPNREETISRDFGSRASPQLSLGGEAMTLQEWCGFPKAMDLLKQEDDACLKFSGRAGLQASLGGQASILRDWGCLEEAMDLLRRQEKICLKDGDQASLQACLGNQALILRARGRLDEARQLLDRQEDICRKHYHAGMPANLGNRALILWDLGCLEDAMALLEQLEAICRDLSNRDGLQASLGGQALILRDWKRWEEAMDLLQQQETICRDLGDRAGLQITLCNQAVILQDQGHPEEAMDLYRKAEAICQDLSNRFGLARCRGNMALILRGQGRIPEARGLLLDALKTFEELKMPRETEEVRGILRALPPEFETEPAGTSPNEPKRPKRVVHGASHNK
jgi:tetratricopeptide (TPR) repeat protein